MTLKRLALITTTLLPISLGFGCAAQANNISSDTAVRLGSMDFNRSPLAMGAGDTLGVSLHRTQTLD
jgi:hypothetical protein